MLNRRQTGIAIAAAVTAVGLVVSPALSAIAMTGGILDSSQKASALSALVGRFTPATGDPRLLARYAQVSDAARSNFRFTPAMSSSEARNVVLVVRARPVSAAEPAATLARVAIPAKAGMAPTTITPVAYKLGKSVGFTSFATGLTVTKPVDIAALQPKRPEDKLARPSRFSADISDREARTPAESAAVDVTSSYRLTRNVDVTAGVRYQRDSDRMVPMTDDRRDSQAVYVGTRFRFR